MASAESQRQMVVPDISATSPRSRATRRISSTERREKGTPRALGSSQAMAFTSITVSRGENRRSAAAGQLLQTRKPLLEEALTPLADHLSTHEEPYRDLIVAETFS